jgi:predicted nucleic acid-binding protein
VIFVDTSVLIAAAHASHERHRASREVWNHCTRKGGAVSVHALAELYSGLTAMPPSLRLRPRDAALAIKTFLERLTPIALTAHEYAGALTRAAGLGLAGGIIYDALHLECARKCAAERIYTWNLLPCRAAAPDLAERIVTP